jgi:hypothetical protein
LPPTILASDAVQLLFDELLVIVRPRAATLPSRKNASGK